jgi:uncharacterized protein
MSVFYDTVAKELKIKAHQVENTIKLLDEGATVPFVARYRKELTGDLDETVIRDILERMNYLRNLQKRKEEVLKSIEEQDKLTEELKGKILKAEKLQEVEDLYLPYKRKKKTKADIAKDQGLEPLAKLAFGRVTYDELLKKSEEFLSEDVKTTEEAIEGVKLILAQENSENPLFREEIRGRMQKSASLYSKATKKAPELDIKQVYRDYYEYNEAVSKIPSHRILAVNRGENEKILNVSIKFDDKTRSFIENMILREYKNQGLKDFYLEIIKDSLDRLILPSIEREVRNILTEKAEGESIESFKENLKNLLMQPPLQDKNILGLDPAYRTGCKTVVIDKDGFFKCDDVLYLVEGMHNPKQLEQAKNKIIKYIDQYDIDIIAIGNGTASRETESFVAGMLKEVKKNVYYLIVNEAGASVYSASKLAKEEFPDLDVTARGAISIAKRIQDPLAELVKIDPKSIGVGMYQHDVNQSKLDDSLGEVIESVVNSVGVNVNSASWVLLSYISGIKKNAAKSIVDYRKENGNFTNRKELLKVKGIGAKAYEQMAGFLVIQDGKNILDNTIIHPESYGIAEEILKKAGFTLDKYRKSIEDARTALKNFDIEAFAEENGYGKETVRDIYGALIGDRRDPREELEKPILKSDILKMGDLKPGMELEGTVRNVVKFGAFIDIGLKNDALLHVSEISDTFISDPSKVLSVGQIIKVKIKDVDFQRERVTLTKKEK